MTGNVVILIKPIGSYFLPEEQVDMPRGAYKGQKLIKLVRTMTAARIIRMIPSVPLIRFVKNSATITAAIINLIILSAEPMFFFIMIALNVYEYNYKGQ